MIKTILDLMQALNAKQIGKGVGGTGVGLLLMMSYLHVEGSVKEIEQAVKNLVTAESMKQYVDDKVQNIHTEITAIKKTQDRIYDKLEEMNRRMLDSRK